MFTETRQALNRARNDMRVFGMHAWRVEGAKFMGRQQITTWLRGPGEVTLRPADSDLETYRQVYQQRQYEIPGAFQRQRLERYYDKLVADGVVPLIIDAGANIGAAAQWFADHFPKARILAVEPDPANAALCRTNTAGRANVTTVEGAIGGKAGAVAMAPGLGEQSWAITTARLDDSPGAGSCKVHTVRDLQRQISGPSALFLVKIDIEGFEADLFDHDVGWVDEVAAIFIEPHDWLFPDKSTSQSMQKSLFNRGFEILVSGENLMFIRSTVDLDRMLKSTTQIQ